jgi:peptidoglycan/xylan/chitin deacetylase (PgdA/CDA1 family)
MTRREFNKTMMLATSSMMEIKKPEKHILTFSFDDGFQKSFIKTAALFEKHKLSACFNVIAAGHLPTFVPPDKWVAAAKLGDFTLWNELKARGHELMPHSWQHLNYQRVKIEDVKDDVNRCLDYFGEHLKGFKVKEAIYNLPFNSSNAEVEAFILSNVKALRTKLPNINAENPLPNKTTRLVSCESFGDQNMDEWLDKKINNFLQNEPTWMVINAHGLDEEGWGPISSQYLEKTLDRLVQLPNLEILPTAKVLKKFGKK